MKKAKAKKQKPSKKSAKKPAKKKTVKRAKKAAPSGKSLKPAPKLKEEKKPPFRPNPDKLDVVRQTFVTTLWKFEALPPEQVRSIVQEQIAAQLADEFADYFDHVFRILTRHRLLEEVPNRVPVHIRLVQRLDE